MKNKFSSRLKELREEEGLSQEKLGKIFSLTQPAIAKWESGEREPCLDLVLELAAFFKVTAGYILGSED